MYKCTAIFLFHSGICITWLFGHFDIIYSLKDLGKKRNSIYWAPEKHQIFIMLHSCIWVKIKPQNISIYTAFTGLTGESCWSKDTYYIDCLWLRKHKKGPYNKLSLLLTSYLLYISIILWLDEKCFVLGKRFNKSKLAYRNESVQFSRSIVSDSLWLHGLQHARPPWHQGGPTPSPAGVGPSPTPRVYSNSNVYIKHYEDNLFLKWS